MVNTMDGKDNKHNWDESVSFLLDSEPTDFDPANLDTPYGRQVWDQYHLIGDVMRDPQLAIQPSDLFYARLSKRLEAEPSHIPQRRNPWVIRAVAGLALAASVAALTWVLLPSLGAHLQSEQLDLAARTSNPEFSVHELSVTAPSVAVVTPPSAPVAFAQSSVDTLSAPTVAAAPNDSMVSQTSLETPSAEVMSDMAAQISHSPTNVAAEIALNAPLQQAANRAITRSNVMRADVGEAGATSVLATASKTVSLETKPDGQHEHSDAEANTPSSVIRAPVRALKSPAEWQRNFQSLIERHNQNTGLGLGIGMKWDTKVEP